MSTDKPDLDATKEVVADDALQELHSNLRALMSDYIAPRIGKQGCRPVSAEMVAVAGSLLGFAIHTCTHELSEEAIQEDTGRSLYDHMMAGAMLNAKRGFDNAAAEYAAHNKRMDILREIIGEAFFDKLQEAVSITDMSPEEAEARRRGDEVLMAEGAEPCQCPRCTEARRMGHA